MRTKYLMFYSKPDCGPCKPAWETTAQALETFPDKLDVVVHMVPLTTPDDIASAKRLGVRSVPTIRIEDASGNEVTRLTGAEITADAVQSALGSEATW